MRRAPRSSAIGSLRAGPWGLPLLVLAWLLLAPGAGGQSARGQEVSARTQEVELFAFDRLGGATSALVRAGMHAYAVQGASLAVFDLRAGGLREVTEARTALPDLAEDLAIDHGRLYLPLRGAGDDDPARLQVFDLSEPARPRPIGAPLSLPAREVGAIAVAYPQAYLLTDRGLLILDLKDRDRPRHRRSVPLPASGVGRSPWHKSGGLAVDEGRVFVAGGAGLLWIDADEPHPLARPIHERASRALSVHGRLMLVALAGGDLELHDLDAPFQPRLRLGTDLDGPQALALGPDLAYVVGDEGRRMLRVRVSERALLRLGGEPRALARERSPDAALAVAGDDVIVGLSTGGLLRTGPDPDVPPVLQAPPPLPPVQHLAALGDRALASAGEAGLYLLDAREGVVGSRILARLQPVLGPRGPELRPATPAPPEDGDAPPLPVLAALPLGPLAVVLTEGAGLLVVDPSRAGRDGVLGWLPGLPPLRGRSDAVLRGARLHLAAGDGSLRTIDLTRPASPRETAVLPGLGLHALALAGDRLVGLGGGGLTQGRLTVFELDAAGSPAVLGRVDLATFHDRIAVRDDVAYLSGAGERLRLVDLSDARAPRVLPAPRGEARSAGRVAFAGELVLAARADRLELFAASGDGTPAEKGALDALGALRLPWSGESWSGRTDVLVHAGRMALLRGRSGLFVGPGPVVDDRAPALAGTPMPPRVAGPLWLPYLRSAPLTSSTSWSSSEASASRTAPPPQAACLPPALVVLAQDGLAPGSARRLGSRTRALSAALSPEGPTVAVGRYGAQGELLALGAPGDAAWLARLDARARTPMAGPNARPDQGARLDLALALAQRQAEASGVEGREAALVVLAGRPAAPSARGPASSLARSMEARGWRLALVATDALAGAEMSLAGLDGLVRPRRAAGEAELVAALAEIAAELEACR